MLMIHFGEMKESENGRLKHTVTGDDGCSVIWLLQGTESQEIRSSPSLDRLQFMCLSGFFLWPFYPFI